MPGLGLTELETIRTIYIQNLTGQAARQPVALFGLSGRPCYGPGPVAPRVLNQRKLFFSFDNYERVKLKGAPFLEKTKGYSAQMLSVSRQSKLHIKISVYHVSGSKSENKF